MVLSVKRKQEVSLQIIHAVLRELEENEGLELLLSLSNTSRTEAIEAANWLYGELIEAARENED